MIYLQTFIYLQVLDLLTTLVGFRVGAEEASPFIRWMMHAGPEIGVAASKLFAFAIAGLCLYLKRTRILKIVNYWYAALIIWNLSVILTS